MYPVNCILKPGVNVKMCCIKRDLILKQIVFKISNLYHKRQTTHLCQVPFKGTIIVKGNCRDKIYTTLHSYLTMSQKINKIYFVNSVLWIPSSNIFRFRSDLLFIWIISENFRCIHEIFYHVMKWKYYSNE